MTAHVRWKSLQLTRYANGSATLLPLLSTLPDTRPHLYAREMYSPGRGAGGGVLLEQSAVRARARRPIRIRDNPDVQKDAPLSQLFSDDFWGKPMSSNVSHKSYRPLTVLTFRLNYALHGLEPWGYHALNVALHAVVTALLEWLCRHAVFAETDLAFLAMAFFAAHPVHTEAVSERS